MKTITEYTTEELQNLVDNGTKEIARLTGKEDLVSRQMLNVVTQAVPAAENELLFRMYGVRF